MAQPFSKAKVLDYTAAASTAPVMARNSAINTITMGAGALRRKGPALRMDSPSLFATNT
jgi:hypothetical protein